MRVKSCGANQLSNEKRAPGCWGYIGDDILPSYVRLTIKHYKDPYETTRISWAIFFVSQLVNLPDRHLLPRLLPSCGGPVRPDGRKTHQKNLQICWSFDVFLFCWIKRHHLLHIFLKRFTHPCICNWDDPGRIILARTCSKFDEFLC